MNWWWGFASQCDGSRPPATTTHARDAPARVGNRLVDFVGEVPGHLVAEHAAPADATVVLARRHRRIDLDFVRHIYWTVVVFRLSLRVLLEPAAPHRVFQIQSWGRPCQ